MSFRGRDVIAGVSGVAIGGVGVAKRWDLPQFRTNSAFDIPRPFVCSGLTDGLYAQA